MTALKTATHAADPDACSWQIEPQGFFSRHFDLYREGRHVTTLHMQLWREGCDFSITGHDFAIRKSSLWKDAFQLLAGEESVCEVRRSFWSRRFELNAAQQSWAVQPAGWFSTIYHLLAEGRQAGSISRVHVWSRKRAAVFAADVPPPIQVLAIFLVLIVGQRQSKSQ
jgi:hypothetical protein